MTSKTQPVKEKTDKLEFIKIKNVFSAKNAVKRMKRLFTDWEKYFFITFPAKHLYLKYIEHFQN